MELETADAIFFVTYCHHHIAVAGVDGQSLRDLAADQRVITRHRQWIVHTGEHRFVVMRNRRGFAVQDFTGLADETAVGFHNCLMTETDTDNRQLTAQTFEQLRHATGFGRRTRSRRKHQHRFFQLAEFFNNDVSRDLIAINHHVMSARAQLIDEVVCKGIDVIDE